MTAHNTLSMASQARQSRVSWVLLHKLGTLALAGVVPLLVLLSWHVSSVYQWMPQQILPPPVQVGQTLLGLWHSGELLGNLHISAIRVLAGYGLGASLGLILGVMIGISLRFSDYVFPTFKAFSQVPMIAWLPLLIMLVGIDEPLKYLMIAKAVMVPVVVNTAQGIRSVPHHFVEVAQVYRFGTGQMLRHVVFPAATAQIWTGLRYGLANAWLALVVVELLASSEGIGFIIVHGRQLLRMDIVLASVAAVGLLGYLIDVAMSLMEARLLRWRPRGL